MASDPGYRSSAFRGFRHQKKLVPRIRDPRNPEEDVARWDPKTEWGGQVSSAFDASGYRRSGSESFVHCGIAKRDFPIRPVGHNRELVETSCQ